MKRDFFFSPHDRINTRSRAEQRWLARRGDPSIDTSFRCVHCGAHVITNPMFAGVLNRNHCPYCLWSRHLDLLEAGDRLCACKAPMRPIGLTLKQNRKKYSREDSGELMIIHACVDCGRLSINRIAADDLTDRIFAVYEDSLRQRDAVVRLIASQEIRLLVEADHRLVQARLFGRDD